MFFWCKSIDKLLLSMKSLGSWESVTNRSVGHERGCNFECQRAWEDVNNRNTTLYILKYERWGVCCLSEVLEELSALQCATIKPLNDQWELADRTNRHC